VNDIPSNNKTKMSSSTREIWRSDEFPNWEVSLDNKGSYTDIYLRMKSTDPDTGKEQFTSRKGTIAGMLMTSIKGKPDFTINHFEGNISDNIKLQIQKYAFGKQERIDLTNERFKIERAKAEEIEMLLRKLYAEKEWYLKKLQKEKTILINTIHVASLGKDDREFERFAVRLKKQYYAADDKRKPSSPLGYPIINKISLDNKPLTGITRGELWEIVKGKNIFVVAEGVYRARYVKSKAEITIFWVDPVVHMITIKGQGSHDVKAADVKLKTIMTDLMDDDEAVDADIVGDAAASSSTAAALADQLTRKNDDDDDDDDDKDYGAEFGKS